MPDRDKKPDNKSFTYKQSGVDIDKASETLKLAKKSISSTFSKCVLNDLSTFAGLFDISGFSFKEPVIVSSTDGVGTKLLIARQMDYLDFIGQDLVGMCINDVLCCGARPLFFLDYIACGKIDTLKINKIIESISNSCKICGSSLIGGETAEMPDMYDENEVDLAGFAVGIVDKKRIITRDKAKEGDIILGLSSSGFHSNGYSLIRNIIKEKNIDLKSKPVFGQGRMLGEMLLEPTKLYYPLLKTLFETDKQVIHGLAHITGGGFFDNIERIIPEYFDAVIEIGSWDIPEIFRFFQQEGNIKKDEMFRVFNMGIGMVALISEDDYHFFNDSVNKAGGETFRIGKISQGSGKVILNSDL